MVFVPCGQIYYIFSSGCGVRMNNDHNLQVLRLKLNGEDRRIVFIAK